MPKRTTEWEHVLYGSLVMGVRVCATYEKGKWVIEDYKNNRRTKSPLEDRFCGCRDRMSDYDLTKPISEIDIQLLHTSGLPNFREEIHLPVVLGVNVTSSCMNPFYNVSELITNVLPAVIKQRRKEISNILKKLDLPFEPVNLYITGGHEEYKPRT